MNKESFVTYLNEPEIHDGTVQQVIQGDRHLRVLVENQGRLLWVEFSDVQSVKMNRPEGMVLYSLSQMEAPAPYHKFVFTNWDEEDDACLEVIARQVKSP